MLCEPTVALSAVSELLALAEADDRMRGVLVRLGQSLLDLFRPPAPVVPAPAVPVPVLRVPAPAVGFEPRVVSAGAISVPAGAVAAAAVVKPEPPVDLLTVARRLAVKAEACETLAAGGDAEPLQPRYTAAGGGALWAGRADGVRAGAAGDVGQLAAAFANADRAVRLAAVVAERRPATVPLPLALSLLAEATSALNVAVQHVYGRTDADQDLAFRWLREQTRVQRIKIERYMKLDSPADPARWAELRDRLDAALSGLSAERDRAAGLKQVQYHAKKLAAAAAGSAEASEQGRQLVEKVAARVADGLPPSNAELRAVLLPVWDQLPADAADRPGFDRVARAVDEYRAAEVAAAVADEPDEADDPPTVAAVRSAVAGRAMVVIGGQARAESAAALERALGLSRVDWLESRPHESHYHFEAAVRRADVAVVLLLIRFSSHSYAEVQAFCDAAGVPLVRVPGGYGVNQVAHQIAEQAGGKLGVARPAAAAEAAG